MNPLACDDKPIIACSTGTSSNSAISVIRLSGFDNLSSLQEFFSIDLKTVSPQKVVRTNLLSDGKNLDDAVLTFFKAPNSYNGENILEMSVHGNQLNVQRIISLFVDKKVCRLAKPGEFSYRAFQNKKLSLTQVEGLDLFLNANTPLILSKGLEALQGKLHKSYQDLYDRFLKLKASLELSIDFLEDVGEEQADKIFLETFNSFFSLLEYLHERTKGNLSSLVSPSVILVGQANAGKSSLFNALLKNHRSIISSTPGTTRDYVSEYIFLEDSNFKLIDTAGVRESSDEIENEGMRRTFDLIDDAFFRILLINPFQTTDADLLKLAKYNFDLLVVSHADQKGYKKLFEKIKNVPKAANVLELSLGPMGPDEKSGPMGPDGKSGPMGPDRKSGPMGPDKKSGPMGPDKKSGPMGPDRKSGPMGPDRKSGPMGPDSVETVFSLISGKYREICSEDPIAIERHRHLLREIFEKTKEYQALTSEVDDVAILSSELNIIGSKISELIGIISVDDVLSSIFDSFCIGK